MLLDEDSNVGLLGQLLPDRPVCNFRLDLLDESPGRGILRRLSGNRDEVRLGKLGVGTPRDGHTPMIRRPPNTPVDGPGVRDSCANESELAGTRRQPPDAKVL